MSEIKKVSANKNYTAVNIGNMNNIGSHKLVMSNRTFNGKVFLKDALNATGSEISFGMLPPNTDLPFAHTHKKNEESYIILKGSGFFQVDDDCFEIAEGSVIRVAPAGSRGIGNTSNEDMVYIVVQSKENSLEEHTGEDGVTFPFTPKWR